MTQRHSDLSSDLVQALHGCAPDILKVTNGTLDWKDARDMIDSLLFHCKEGEAKWYYSLPREEKDQILDVAFPVGASWV